MDFVSRKIAYDKISAFDTPGILHVLSKIPDGIDAEMKKIMKRFFWNGMNDQNRIPLLTWDNKCKPKKVGRAGLRNFLIMNLEMGEKLVWRLYTNSNEKWIKIIRKKYVNSKYPISILKVRDSPRGSIVWNYILESWDIIKRYITWEIVNGEKGLFCKDS